MAFRLRKYFSVIALLVFLFPTVTEQIHSFHHADDFHCNETVSKHIHPTEHHCNICDFVPIVCDKPILSYQVADVNIFTSCLFVSHNCNVVDRHSFNFSLRGPPAVS